VLIKWPLIGMLLELYGFFLLFGDFLPIVLSFARNLPLIGSLLDLPGIKQMVDGIVNQGRLPV